MAIFPNYKQIDSWDCGPTCVRIIAKHFGKFIDDEEIKNQVDNIGLGTNLLDLERLAFKYQLLTNSVLLTYDELTKQAPLPVICHWGQDHYLTLYKIKKGKFYISDPRAGKYILSKNDFIKNWVTENDNSGICMLIEPSKDFNTKSIFSDKSQSNSIFLDTLKKIRNEHRAFFTLITGLILTLLFDLSLPLFTQAIVDEGILFNDKKIITILIVAQIFFLIVSFILIVIRKYILLFFSMKMNLELMDSYLRKLLNTPLSYIYKRSKGDLITRINDSDKIEKFISEYFVNIIFDLSLIISLSLLLFFYNYKIFILFLVGVSIYIIWIKLFMKKRILLDNFFFNLKGKGQGLELQMINNINDIKINNSDLRRRKEWYKNQIQIIKAKTEALNLSNFQNNFADTIKSVINIIIIFICAFSVTEGTMSLGTMLAIQFIITQTSMPISRMSNFFIDYEETKLSIKRLSEVYNETPITKDINYRSLPDSSEDIELSNLSFSYSNSQTNLLEKFNLILPKKKVTAIVGPSGSGKSTLLKLILGMIKPNSGKISVGQIPLKDIKISKWRNKCGVVLQDGALFNDTLERNITESKPDQKTNLDWFYKICEICLLNDLIEDLPNGIRTKLGDKGILVSGGEKQKILLARALYKEPQYLLLDEASASLDTQNEKLIQNNLNHYFKGRTVLIIAHRLSTIKKADKIIVLNKGKIIETGTHKSLIKLNGFYKNLINNQIGDV